MSNLEDLIGKPLNDFKVIRMTEVYRVNEDGGAIKSEGCFVSAVIARAYANNLVDSAYTDTRSIIVLTDGKVGYSLDELVELVDEDTALDSIRSKALAKLTHEEVQALGFSERSV